MLSGDDAVRADLAADGRAVVAWSEVPPDSFYARSHVTAALRPADGRFGAPAAITPDAAGLEPRAARLTADGGAVVLAEMFGNDGGSMLLVRHIP